MTKNTKLNEKYTQNKQKHDIAFYCLKDVKMSNWCLRPNDTLVISYDSIFDLRPSRRAEGEGPLLVLAHNLGGRRDSLGEINHKYLKWG